jgi:hypothetical protein
VTPDTGLRWMSDDCDAVVRAGLGACKPMVVYLSDQRQAWIDDLAAVESGPLEDASVAGLARLVSGSGLRVVAER